MGILDRRGHQRIGFAAGIAEHDALIAGTFGLAFLVVRIDPLGDMGRLLVQKVLDLDGFPVELFLLVADVADALAHDAIDAAQHLFQLVLVGQADLAADDDAAGGRKGLASNAGMGFDSQERIKDGVGDAVADLVGVTFRNAFGSEDVVLAGHEGCSIGVCHHARKPL